MQPIRPNYNRQNEVKQIKITKESFSQSCILRQLLRPFFQGQNASNILFYLFLPLFTLYLLRGCGLFNMYCLS